MCYRWRRFARVDVVSLEAGGKIVSRGLPGVVEHVAGVGGYVGDDTALAHRHLLPIAAANELKLLRNRELNTFVKVSRYKTRGQWPHRSACKAA